jgi:hypothetical protein
MTIENINHNKQILSVDNQNNIFAPRMDTVTKSLKVISTDDANVHEGKTFIAMALLDSVADNTAVNFVFHTPTVASGKVVYLKSMKYFIKGAKVRTDFYEVAVAPVAGSDMLIYNKNRMSETESIMQAVKTGATLDMTDAKMLEYELIGAGDRVEESRFVLKPDTWYVRLFSNQSGAAADISFKMEWIEE